MKTESTDPPPDADRDPPGPTAAAVLAGIEALAALDRVGTIGEAAVRLRLTQSAVSKRLQALGRAVGFSVTEPVGRRVALTPDGLALLERARPLLAELRELGTVPLGVTGVTPGRTTLSLALADSIAASWGPAVVSLALRRVAGVTVELHAHRSVLVIENLRLGRYQVGLCASVGAADLIEHPVIDEPMVLVDGGTATTGASAGTAPLITIERHSATWRAIEPALRRGHPGLLARRIEGVESFSAALQMVRAGFGDGLVPLGLALESRLDRTRYRRIPGVERRVSLVTRKTVHQLGAFRSLREAIADAARTWFAGSGA